MEDFLTWEVLLTFSGCVAGTVLLTEWLKKSFPKMHVQLVSFIIAALILVIGHIAMGNFVWTELPLYLVNAIAVSLSSNGSFDILKSTFKKDTGIENELVIDNANAENVETYLNLSKGPDEFEDGEVVSFKIKKLDSQEKQSS